MSGASSTGTATYLGGRVGTISGQGRQNANRCRGWTEQDGDDDGDDELADDEREALRAASASAAPDPDLEQVGADTYHGAADDRGRSQASETPSLMMMRQRSAEDKLRLAEPDELADRMDQEWRAHAGVDSRAGSTGVSYDSDPDGVGLFSGVGSDGDGSSEGGFESEGSTPGAGPGPELPGPSGGSDVTGANASNGSRGRYPGPSPAPSERDAVPRGATVEQ